MSASWLEANKIKMKNLALKGSMLIFCYTSSAVRKLNLMVADILGVFANLVKFHTQGDVVNNIHCGLLSLLICLDPDFFFFLFFCFFYTFLLPFLHMHELVFA